MTNLLIATGVIVLVAALGWLYQLHGTARDRRNFPPPGRLVDIGGTRLHLHDSGQGLPVVLLEAGIGASCLNWTNLEAELARFTRVCSYDRAGLGWSDPMSSPRTISNAIEELDKLLARAQIPAPYILTGHSFGGLLVRCYAVRYPGRVAGLVLVDPLAAAEWLEPSKAQWKTLRRAARFSRRGAFLARFGVVRFGLALLSGGARRIPQLVARAASSGSGEAAIARLLREVQKMPSETWPVVRAHWCQPKSFLGMANYLEHLPESSSQAAACRELRSDIPVTILSAANSSVAQVAERDAIAHHSQYGKHIIATKSGHWVHFDEPELVSHAIRDMIEHTRKVRFS